MITEGKTPLAARVAKGGLYGILLLVLAFVVLASASVGPYFFQMLYHLLCGWILHGWKALPHLFGKWQEAVLPVGCLLMAAVLANRFVRRWVCKKIPDSKWRVRHTVAVLSLLLLGSAAAIAASGVVHQMFWLANGKIIESNMRTDITVAVNNGRQLMMALFEYENERGMYPNSFEQLKAEFGEFSGVTRQLWWLDFRDRKVPEPWILLRPGSSETALANEPVIVSPLLAADAMVVVGYGDCSVRRIRADQLKEVLGKNGTKESKDGR